MQLNGNSSYNDSRYLLHVQCDCGGIFEAPLDANKAICPICDAQELIKELKQKWLAQ